MNKSQKFFTKRTFTVLDLPLESENEIPYPEQVLLRIGRQYFDVGEFCYGRKSDKQRSPKQPRLVDELSLIPGRADAIRVIIKTISKISKDKSDRTTFGIIDSFGQFVSWADRNLGYDFLQDQALIKVAYPQYVSFLKSQCPHVFGPVTVNAKLTNSLILLREMLDEDSFGADIRFLSVSSFSEGTRPAEEMNFGHVLSMAQSFFDGLADLLINKLPFPYQLKLPDTLGWSSGNSVWIFPTKRLFIPPHKWHEFRNSDGEFIGPYDYENGDLNHIKSFDNITNVIVHSRQTSLKAAQRLIDRANSDERDGKRMQLARAAHSAFLLLFLANTGCNLGVAKEIETEEEIDATVLNQSFRGIKYRANNLIINITVPVSFMPSLRTFMKLRKFILGTNQSDYLFFTFERKAKQFLPSKLADGPLEKLYQTFNRIDPDLKSIGPRQIRSTVNDWLLRNHDVSTTAMIMGHSEQVEITKYGRGSPVSQMSDMTHLMEKIAETAKKQKIVDTRMDISNLQPVASGGVCANYGNPEKLSDHPILQPDCKNGCWFCANRIIVADEEDIRKISSATYVMEHLINSPKQEAILRPIITKCDDDLNAISAWMNSPTVVNKIKSEVYEKGELTAFWAAKYHHFLELGVLV